MERPQCWQLAGKRYRAKVWTYVVYAPRHFCRRLLHNRFISRHKPRRAIALHTRVIQRLLPHPIAGQEKLLLRLIPDRDRIHAVEALEARLAPGGVAFQEDFGVAI